MYVKIKWRFFVAKLIDIGPYLLDIFEDLTGVTLAYFKKQSVVEAMDPRSISPVTQMRH